MSSDTSVSFSRTMRSLRADRSSYSMLGIGLVSILLAAWAIWLLKGRVAVYAISTTARLEADGASQPVQSLYTGRIAANYLIVGKAVRRGDVLIELDSNVQRLQLLEEQMHGRSLATELVALQREIEAEERAMREEESAAAAGVEEAKAKLREAEAAASYAAVDAERKAKLQAEGLVSQLDLVRANSEIKRQQATVEGLKFATSRLEKEQMTRASERRSRIEALERQKNQLAGMKTKLGATVGRLESELELRRVVAPVSGTIGEAANLKIGTVISAGEKVGVIVPSGALKIVAQFDPAKAVGRIHPGQQARVRLDGFPWTQYGTLTARVSDISNEVRDGLVRVELSPTPGSRLSLQHGLPGTTEVEVEKISPAALLLRIAGQTVTPDRQTPQTKSGPAAPARENAQ